MAENRLVIQQHIEKLPPDLTQDQKIKYIASVLFNGLKTQKTTEQLILLMLHHKKILKKTELLIHIVFLNSISKCSIVSDVLSIQES